jgi:hypothetical protein
VAADNSGLARHMDRAVLDTAEVGMFAAPAAFDTVVVSELDRAAGLASDIALVPEHRDQLAAAVKHKDQSETDTADMANIVSKVMMAAGLAAGLADFPYIAPFFLQVL